MTIASNAPRYVFGSNLTKDQFITRMAACHAKDGYNKSQAKSLAWADFFERQEMKYGLGYCKRYDVFCKDCNVGHVFGASGSMAYFIRQHKDHKTRSVSY